MLTPDNEYSEHDWPVECRFIWDRPLSSQEFGGLSATRGFWYQYLCVLRFMEALLRGAYDGYACEWIEDFLVWKRGPSGTISKLSLVQVKTSTDECFLKKTSKVKKVLRHFSRSVERLSSESSAEILCQVIYNDHHDCDALHCEQQISGLAEYEELNRRLGALGDGASRRIEFQRVLPVPLSACAIIAELEFLNDGYKDLHRFLTSPVNLEVFLRSLLGLVFPFHSGRAGLSLVEPARRGEFPLWKLHHQRSDVISELQQSLENAIQRVRRAHDRAGIKKRLEAAEDNARITLGAASLTEQSIDDKCVRIYDKNKCQHALTLAHMLDGANESFILQPGRFEVNKLPEGWHFDLDKNFQNGLIPLHRYVGDAGSTHLQRIRLILSLARALSSFAQNGVTLCDFRGGDPTFRELYFVEKDRSGQPNIVLGDFSALTFITENGGLLDQHWCRGSVISKALRYLYYGTLTRTDSQKTDRYKAIWNDNVITEFADWLELVKIYIDPTALEKTLTSLFADELNKWPLIITEVDKQFISDIAYNGIDAIATALCESTLTGLVQDRGPWEQNVYYVSSQTEQFGLLLKDLDKVCLYRYMPYLTRRWQRAKRRDSAVALPLIGKSSRATVSLVRLGEPAVLSEFLKEVFDVDLDEYESWFWTTEKNVTRKRYQRSAEFPESLRLEEELLRERRVVLDVLSHEFGFNVRAEEAQSELRSKMVFRLSEKVKLPDCLQCLGYPPETFTSLKVTVFDDAGQKFDGTIEEIVTTDDGTTDIHVALLQAGVIGDKGTLRLFDPGEDTVIGSEEALLRELRFSLADAQPDRQSRAVQTAWQIVRHMCGAERPRPRVGEKLWKGSFQLNNQRVNADAIVAERLKDWLLKDGDQPEQSWRAIVGAAGTGKTRQTASLVFDHLEAKSARIFPPTRVLVVAATHYALDNFMRAFKGLAHDKYAVFRFVPHKRLDELIERKVVSSELFEWSIANKKRIESELPEPNFERTPATLQDASIRVDQEIATTTALLQRSNSQTPLSSFIPSHERWRKACGLVSDLCDVDELNTRLGYLEWRSQQIHSSLVKTPYAPAKDFDRGPLRTASNVHALFASDVLVTTVDAFDRLPDIFFDLVVVEEASQLRLLKLLKVFNKVMRGRSDCTAPKILMSGDPQQLPPFIELFNKPDRDLFRYLSPTMLREARSINRLRLRELRAMESPFDSLCKRHGDTERVACLRTQWRMRPNIACVVSSLFYSDEDWWFPPDHLKSDLGRIIWMNSTGHSDALGTSAFNESEVTATKKLINWLKPNIDDVLVITPYAAQVTKLRSGLPWRIKITTIDGCQGIEAPFVIVSFVTLDFSLTHDFVIEPRRMNVALSRASEVLCLVGNYQQLAQNIKQVEPNAFPHMTGLAKFFSRKGPTKGAITIGF